LSPGPRAPTGLRDLLGRQTIRLGFCELDGNEYRMTTADLSADLIARFGAIAEEAVTNLAKSALRSYIATERLGENTQGYLDARNGQGEARLLRAELVSALDRFRNCAALEDFDFAHLDRPPLFYILIYSDGKELALFGRSLTARQIPRRQIRAVFRQGELRALQDELLLFDEAIDWIYYSGRFYVAVLPAFERLFIDRAQLRARVDAYVNEIRTVLDIVGVDEFADRVSKNLNMSVKLQRIVERGDFRGFTVPKLKDYGHRYKSSISWDGDSIVFRPAPADQWDILTLLDEAWYSGELSSRPFEATSKLPVDQ